MNRTDFYYLAKSCFNQFFLRFVKSPPKSRAKITSENGEDPFLVLTKIFSVFAPNLFRNRFLVLAGSVYADHSKSLWAVPQKSLAHLI